MERLKPPLILHWPENFLLALVTSSMIYSSRPFSTAKIGKITLISRCHVSLFASPCFTLDFFLFLLLLAPRNSSRLSSARSADNRVKLESTYWGITDNSKLIKLSNVSENIWKKIQLLRNYLSWRHASMSVRLTRFDSTSNFKSSRISLVRIFQFFNWKIFQKFISYIRFLFFHFQVPIFIKSTI